MGKVFTYSDNTIFLTDTGVQVNKYTIPLSPDDHIENLPDGTTRVVRDKKVMCSFNRYTELSPALIDPAPFTGRATEDAITIVDIFSGYDAGVTMVWAVVYSNETIEYFSDAPFGTPMTPSLPIVKEKIWSEGTGTVTVTNANANTISLNPGSYYVLVKNTGGGVVNVTSSGTTVTLQPNESQVMWNVQQDPISHLYKKSPSMTVDSTLSTATIIEYT